MILPSWFRTAVFLDLLPLVGIAVLLNISVLPDIVPLAVLLDTVPLVGIAVLLDTVPLVGISVSLNPFNAMPAAPSLGERPIKVHE